MTITFAGVKEMYEKILVRILPRLVTDHQAGGIEETEPSKQVLIF